MVCGCSFNGKTHDLDGIDVELALLNKGGRARPSTADKQKGSNFLSPLLRYSAPGGLRQAPDRDVESDLQEWEE